MDRSTPARQRRIVFEVARALVRAGALEASRNVARARRRHAAAVAVQRQLRRHLCRGLLAELRGRRAHLSAVRIQALARGSAARRRLRKITAQRALAASERLSRLLLRAWRARQRRLAGASHLRLLRAEQEAAVALERHRSSVAIQRVFRGGRDRRSARPLLLERRERLSLLDQEARRLQGGLRRLSVRRRTQRALAESRAAATIQRFLRFCVAHRCEARRRLGGLLLRLLTGRRRRTQLGGAADEISAEAATAQTEGLPAEEVAIRERAEKEPESLDFLVLSAPRSMVDEVLAALASVLTVDLLCQLTGTRLGEDLRVAVAQSLLLEEEGVGQPVVARVYSAGVPLPVVLRSAESGDSVFDLAALRSGATLSYRGTSLLLPFRRPPPDHFESAALIPSPAAEAVSPAEALTEERAEQLATSATVIQVLSSCTNPF